MKKTLIYIILGLLVLAIGFLLFSAGNTSDRTFDDRLSLNKADKIPYGYFIAYESLSQLFPEARISAESAAPGYWDSISLNGDNQALIIMVPHFRPEEEELTRLINFIMAGNDVFISAGSVSSYVEKHLKCDVSGFSGPMLISEKPGDSIVQSILNKEDSSYDLFSYPGIRLGEWFYGFDTASTEVLGYNKESRPNFIHLRAGKGNLFLHLSPLAYTNYFLLQRNNLEFYERSMSYLSPNINKIVWDEYFKKSLSRRSGNSGKKGWMSAFMEYPSLKWALITAMLTILLFVIAEARRKQRPIPVINRPGNDSLDFVRTIGRLYHDKGDHKNLAVKMSGYFLDHVRTKYKIGTSRLNEEFLSNLHHKSGVEIEQLREIVKFILIIESSDRINEKQLVYFHQQLETFYKNA